MSTVKFTPGPWRVHSRETKSQFTRNWREIEPNVVTASSYHSNRDGEVFGVQINEANARLIAAAPALYEACKAAKHALVSYECGNNSQTLARDVGAHLARVLTAAEGKEKE